MDARLAKRDPSMIVLLEDRSNAILRCRVELLREVIERPDDPVPEETDELRVFVIAEYKPVISDPVTVEPMARIWIDVIETEPRPRCRDPNINAHRA